MKKGTATRRAFDQALQALPITQHHRVSPGSATTDVIISWNHLSKGILRSRFGLWRQVWELYIPWIKEFEVKDTAIRVYRRFLKYDPSFREEYVDYLEKHGEIDEAAQQLAICVNDDSFISPKGRRDFLDHPAAVSQAMHYITSSRTLRMYCSRSQARRSTSCGCGCATCAPRTPRPSRESFRCVLASNLGGRGSRLLLLLPADASDVSSSAGGRHHP